MKIKKLLLFLFVLFLLGLLSFYYPKLTGKAVEKTEDYKPEPAFAIKIIDGDTIESDIGKIRLLGINTPEKGKPYSKEALNFLKQIENKSLIVLRDKEDLDKYGRKLRYIFYGNQFINAEILQKGLATSFMLNGLQYKEKLKKAEDYARANGIELWEKSADICVNCIKLSELNSKEEFFVLRNECDFDCELSGWVVKDDANHFFKINSLNSGESESYKSEASIWNDNEDRFFLRDSKGKLVLFYEYFF